MYVLKLLLLTKIVAARGESCGTFDRCIKRNFVALMLSRWAGKTTVRLCWCFSLCFDVMNLVDVLDVLHLLYSLDVLDLLDVLDVLHLLYPPDVLHLLHSPHHTQQH